ncbi:MAG: DUF3253 domain-containing protein [Pseudomonadota bacterium]
MVIFPMHRLPTDGPWAKTRWLTFASPVLHLESAMKDADVAAALLAMAKTRGPGRTFCPSEVARGLFLEWRLEMDRVRRVAKELERLGQLQATQGGVAVSLSSARGPIRLGLPGA